MNNLKYLYFLGFALFCVVGVSRANHLAGGIKELEGEQLSEAIELLDTSLTKLAEGDGPAYKNNNVISASRQVVAGLLYRYNVELVDGDIIKQCTVKILQQPWMPENGTQITIKCEGDGNEVKSSW